MRLQGKVAVVTGASQGIGEVIALRVAAEGAKTVLAARSEENLAATGRRIAEAGGTSLIVSTDVTDESSVVHLMERTSAEFGPIDILINNSGVAGPMKPIENIASEEWDECFSVNVTGMFLCCKHAIPFMQERGSGRIVNISSMSGKRPLVHRSPYTASKMAVIGLTRTLAFELGEFGITVNAVCPGATEGERIRRVIANEAKALDISLEDAERNFTGGAALGTLVSSEDTAGMCVFLCSEDSRHMTGQDFNVTAGLCGY